MSSTDAEALPRARSDLVFRRVGEEWVVFDPRTQRMHVLNLAAALVWSFCTGETSVKEIEDEVRAAYPDADDPGVRALLAQFRAAGLLEP